MTDDLWDRQNKTLGAFIRAQRELASLSLRQLSEMTDVSNAYLSQIERGLHEPSIRVIRSVARALGVAPEVLLARAGLRGDEASPAEGAGSGGGNSDQPTSDGTEPGADDADPAKGRSKRAMAAPSTEEVIRADPKLTDPEKDALLSVYRSYVANKG